MRYNTWEQHRKPVEERFLEKVNKDGPLCVHLGTKCWVWMGGTYPEGYGEIKIDGYVRLAHRVSWEIANGEVPDGLCVLHKCDNPACVRPDHLFLGTKKDNVDDMVNKGRHRNNSAGERNANRKLTNTDVIAMRERFSMGGISASALARIHKISPRQARDIVKYRAWKSVK
jgi:hypothetical protein